MKTYEKNVEYETRILKLQHIIEKLEIIEDNLTKLNQKVCFNSYLIHLFNKFIILTTVN